MSSALLPPQFSLAAATESGACWRMETVANPSAERHAADTRPKRIRSAVTNGRRLYVNGDGNSAWSRRYRDLVQGHVADMGGRDLLSEAQLSLIKRASAIECELEQM